MVNPRVIEYQYGVLPAPFGLVELSPARTITRWDESLGVQPTDEALALIEESQAFIDWLEEHGGDPVKTTRRGALDLADVLDRERLLIRALGRVTYKSVVEVRQTINAIIDHLNGNGSVPAKLPNRTWNQLKQAIKDEIASGDAEA